MSQQWDDLATLDRRITRQESAIGSQVADLLKQGMDARVIQSATTELEADLLRLRHHRKRIVAWAEAQKTESDQARKLEAFAAQAAKSLSDTSPKARRRIIDCSTSISASPTGSPATRATAQASYPKPNFPGSVVARSTTVPTANGTDSFP